MKKPNITFIDIIILFVITLNVLDFFEILPPDASLVENLISWSAMIYILYEISFTRILIGYKQKLIDLVLLTSYILIVLKDLVYYTIHTNFYYFEKYSKIIQPYQADFQLYSFGLSAILIILLSIYISKSIKIESKSMLGAFGFENKKLILKFLITLLSISFIAYFIFMMAFQWFAVVIDAPLVLIGIFYYFFAKKRAKQEKSKIKIISDFSDNIIERFVNFFHSKETFHLGLISILILHFFTDLFVFIIPTFISLKESLYTAAIENSISTTLFNLFIENIKNQDYYTILNISIIYLANMVFVIVIIAIPILLLKSIYNKKEIEPGKIINTLILIFLPIYLIFPLYNIVGIKNFAYGISGVNITLTKIQITSITEYVLPLFFLILLVLFILYRFTKINLKKSPLILVFIPIIKYVINYFESTVNYYVYTISHLLALKNILILLFLLIFLLLIIFFYWTALAMLIYETIKYNFESILKTENDTKLLKNIEVCIATFGIIYLFMYYVSAVFSIFKNGLINFMFPIIITIIIFILPKMNELFKKPDFKISVNQILLTPLSALIGAIFGLSFIYYRESLGYESNLIYLIVIYLLFVAISEEIIFRYYFQNCLKDFFGFKKAMIIQSLTFALMHTSKSITIELFIVLFTFAICATIVKEKLGLTNAIVMHFTANMILYLYLIY